MGQQETKHPGAAKEDSAVVFARPLWDMLS